MESVSFRLGSHTTGSPIVQVTVHPNTIRWCKEMLNAIISTNAGMVLVIFKSMVWWHFLQSRSTRLCQIVKKLHMCTITIGILLKIKILMRTDTDRMSRGTFSGFHYLPPVEIFMSRLVHCKA